MSAYSVFLGLGSNLGERQKLMQQAVDGLKQVQDTKIVWTSSVYETDPVGITDQPKFLNACVEIETSLEPRALLAEAKRIEELLGRSAQVAKGPREIDIDILLYDGKVFEDEIVTVPHPELDRRRFVLIPLREIAPDLVHPVTGLTVTEMADACQEGGRVVKTSYRLFV